MRSLRELVILSISLVAHVAAQNAPVPSLEKPSSSAPAANQDFQELLKALPEESLHAALNDHLQPKFKDGVFEYHKRALEAVHASDPPLATKLIIVAAKHELVRRQNVSVSVSPPPPPPSTPPAVVIPISETMTDSSGRVSVITTSALAPPPTSVVVPVTTTDSQGNTVVTSSTAPAIVIETTNSAGSIIRTASPVPTVGQVITTTNSQGSRMVTTYTPDALVVSSVVLQTETMPDGSVVTLTSYALVNPTQSRQPSGSQSPTGTAKTPGLQSLAGRGAAIPEATFALVFGAVIAVLFW